MVATKISELGAAPSVDKDSVIVVNAGGVTYQCTAKALLDVLGTAGFFFADPPQVRSNLGLSATNFAQTLLGKASAATARDHLDASQSPLDEDDFASNSAARPPSQQSTKAYIATQIEGALTDAPAAGDVTRLYYPDTVSITWPADEWRPVFRWVAPDAGGVRFTGELFGDDAVGGIATQFRVLSNGVVLTTQSHADDSWGAFSVDVAFAAGALIEAQVRRRSAVENMRFRNIAVKTTAASNVPGAAFAIPAAWVLGS